MKMKKLLSILLASAMVLSLAACGGTQTPTTPAAETPVTEPASAEPDPAPADTDDTSTKDATEASNELNLAIFEGGYGRAFWDGAAAAFEAETGITVNLTISPDIGDIIRPQIVAGDVPDFLNLATDDQTGITLAMMQERALMDLTDVFNGPQFDSDAPLNDKVFTGFLESKRSAPYGDGRNYFAPGNYYPLGLIYNISLFEEKGWDLPVTWDDFFALGDLAKAEGIALLTYQGLHPGYLECMLYPALASTLGADYEKLENNEPGIWLDPRVLTVMEQFEKIYADGYLLRGTLGMNHIEGQAAQMMNHALFIPCGPWMEGEMEEAERAEGYRFGLTPPPVMNANDPRFVSDSFEMFSIPANAPNAENAKLFLRFLYTDEMIKLYGDSGALMPTNNTLDLVRDSVSEGVYNMFGIYDMPGSVALVLSDPLGLRTAQLDDMNEILSGRWTAQQYIEARDAIN